MEAQHFDMTSRKSSPKTMPKSISFNMRKSSDLVIRLYSDVSTISLLKNSSCSMVAATQASSQDARSASTSTIGMYNDKGRKESHGDATLVLELEVHSQVLTEQSEFFEKQLSGRWLSNGTVDDCLANHAVCRSRSACRSFPLG